MDEENGWIELNLSTLTSTNDERRKMMEEGKRQTKPNPNDGSSTTMTFGGRGREGVVP